eukprot:TRINITY_DN51405_c0_g1_i1.p1 TRINITY_DN51405_c0_g1~~TRINITY_DN51405_c0_g1_i1.p1  ORF type:complete len:217 (+),score=30.24 TRINITY_DN51405_c0_g1_i1:78-653(+)
MGGSKSKTAYWTSAIGQDLKCYQSRHDAGSVCPNTSASAGSMVNCQVKSCKKRGYTIRNKPPFETCILDSGRQKDKCQVWTWGRGGNPPAAVGPVASAQALGILNFGGLSAGLGGPTGAAGGPPGGPAAGRGAPPGPPGPPPPAGRGAAGPPPAGAPRGVAPPGAPGAPAAAAGPAPPPQAAAAPAGVAPG